MFSAQASDSEWTRFRVIIGDLWWIPRQGRSDETVTASLLPTSFPNAAVNDILDATLAIGRLKSTVEVGNDRREASSFSMVSWQSHNKRKRVVGPLTVSASSSFPEPVAGRSAS